MLIDNYEEIRKRLKTVGAYLREDEMRKWSGAMRYINGMIEKIAEDCRICSERLGTDGKEFRRDIGNEIIGVCNEKEEKE